MRAFALSFAALLGVSAAPVLAQPIYGPQAVTQAQAAQLQAQQEFAARQAVIQQNEISRLDAQLRTEQNMATLRAFGPAPPVRAAAPLVAGAAVPHIDVSGLASIPDSALAASNARVKAAADSRP